LKILLLDGVGAGFLLFLFALGILFIFLAIFIEAIVMFQMKYLPNFKMAFIQSLVVNLVSLASGFILSSVPGDNFTFNTIQGFAALFVSTVIVEFIVLYLMNKKVPLARTAVVCLIMNIITYTIAYLVTNFI
jgi:hypothetical protein